MEEGVVEKTGIAKAKAGMVRPSRRHIGRARYRHDAIIEALIRNPAITHGELAKQCGYSRMWIGQILASPAFKERMEKRQDRLIDPTLKSALADRISALTLRSIDILQEKLNKPSSEISDLLAVRVLEVSTRGVTRDTAPVVQVNVQNHLEVLGENLTQLLRRRKVEAEPLPLLPAP